jgi:arylsulfatase A-like enzyme
MILHHDFIQQPADGLITTLAKIRGLAGRMSGTRMSGDNAMSRMRTSLASLALAVSIIIVGTPISPTGAPARVVLQSRGSARLILIVVMDGLRPDSINREDTPTLFRLRQEGVSYINSHSVFPTVTRVNSAAISTGTYPDVNGLVSNSMFVPGVHPTRPFNTSDYRQLLKLREVSGGHLLFARSLAERLLERAIRFAAVSSGSTGSALLLSHRAPEGIGVLVNGNFDPGRRVAYPDESNAVIISRFGAAPSEENSSAVDWADRVLRDYVLPELQPEVVIDWQTEPDGAQHRYGTGSQEARKALANNDRNLALTLAKLQDLGLADKTDVIVLSDHGFSLHNFRVDARRALINAGLKAAADSDDVVLASNGQSVLVHVKGRDLQRIRRIVRFLQSQDWVDVIFTAGGKPAVARRGQSARGRNTDDELGSVPGTFSLGLIRQANAARGPDILFTLPWSSAVNAFGVAGKHYTDGDGNPGPLVGAASGHGGMSPWVVRNTLILWGADFKRGVAVRTAAGNVDIAPTILALKGVSGGESLDGRVLAEALRDGPDEEQIPSDTKVLRTEAVGGYRAAVQVTDVGSHRYIDKGWRIR